MDAFNKPQSLITNRLVLRSSLPWKSLYFVAHNRNHKQTMKKCAAPGAALSYHHHPDISNTLNMLGGSVWLQLNSMVSTNIYSG